MSASDDFSTPVADSSWSCAQCSQTFNQSKRLEKHALDAQHKAYRCFCGRTFTRRTASVRHSKIHATQKRHQCSVCQKTFFRRDHCAEHEDRCVARARASNQQAAEDGGNDSVTMSEASPPANQPEMIQRGDEPASASDASESMSYLPDAQSNASQATNSGSPPPQITRLIDALRDDDLPRVREVLSTRPNVNHQFRSGSGPLPLHLAASYSSPQIIRLLLEAGANVNATDNFGRSAMHVASLKGREEVVVCLRQHEASIALVDGRGRTPLHLAALQGHLGVTRALRMAGADVDIEDEFGRTPYMVAAIHKHKAVAACLLAEGISEFRKVLAAEGVGKPKDGESYDTALQSYCTAMDQTGVCWDNEM